MSRFPPKTVAEQPENLKEVAQVYQDLAAAAFGPNDKYFKWHDDKGAVIGPFPFLVESGKTGLAFRDLVQSLGQYKDDLPSDAKEIAILNMGVRFKAAYETYGHANVATRHAGLTEAQVDSILNGKKPEGLNPKALAAYEATYHLAHVPGPLPQDLFDNSVKALGRQGTIALIHYSGLYSYISIVLNAGDVPVPQ